MSVEFGNFVFTNFKASFSPVLMDFSLTGPDQKLKKMWKGLLK